MARKKKRKAAAPVEGEELQEGKKKKKKLPLLLLLLVLLIAAAAAVVIFVLPRFGINLLGFGGDGDTGDSSLAGDPLPKKGLESYTVGEDTVASLDTFLEEGEGELIANRGPGKVRNEDDEVEEKYTYIYEITAPAEVMNRYLDLMLGDEGFVLADETYLVNEERPELEDAEGALMLVRNSVVEGHLFQLVIGWSQANDNLAVRVSAPEAALHYPEPEREPDVTSVSDHMEQIRSMTPAQLGLPGDSMDEYTIFPVDGMVKVNKQDCRRFNLYERGTTGTIAGTYLLSVDGQHMYVLDPDTNKVSTIR